MSRFTPPQGPGELRLALVACPLFEGLGDADLRVVVQAGRRRAVEPDAFLFRQGDQATVMYVLLEGRAKLTQLTPEGQQVVLRYANPGDVLGVVAGLGDDVYPASAQAVGACKVVGWDGETMGQLLERYPRLTLNALRSVATRVRELQDRLREMATERVERRVARAVLRLAGQTGRKVEGGVLITLPLSRQDLAEMTGTTLYTVSRILSAWEQKGLVQAGREQVLIRVPHGLVSIADDLPPRMRPPRDPQE